MERQLVDRVLEDTKEEARQLPTLPPIGSTIGVRVLNFRVRDGNGCVHPAVATGPANSKCLGTALCRFGEGTMIWLSLSDD